MAFSPCRTPGEVYIRLSPIHRVQIIRHIHNFAQAILSRSGYSEKTAPQDHKISTSNSQGQFSYMYVRFFILLRLPASS